MPKCETCGKDVSSLKAGFEIFRHEGKWYCKEHYTEIQAQKKEAVVEKRLETLEAKGELVFSETMTDEEIRKGIEKSIVELAMHEAGSAWMRLGTLISMNPTEQIIGAGFKALIDLNKIIIRQNELILRELKKS